VRQNREELGIPNPAGTHWCAKEVALLSTLPDQEVGRRPGRPLKSVTRKRCKPGIS
jgi:hypothetical protein